jgi:murein endopeptidase
MNFALASAKAVAKRKAREKHLNSGLRDEMDFKKKRKKANAAKAEPQVGVVDTGCLRSAARLAVVSDSYQLCRCNAAIV